MDVVPLLLDGIKDGHIRPSSPTPYMEILRPL